jgi:hypothetical protein
VVDERDPRLLAAVRQWVRGGPAEVAAEFPPLVVARLR